MRIELVLDLLREPPGRLPDLEEVPPRATRSWLGDRCNVVTSAGFIQETGEISIRHLPQDHISSGASFILFLFL
jgi:hypothetical protein